MNRYTDRDTQTVDRLARSHTLVWRMHHAALQAGAEHFTSLVILNRATSS